MFRKLLILLTIVALVILVGCNKSESTEVSIFSVSPEGVLTTVENATLKGEIVIPSEIKGTIVHTIGKNCFNHCEEITEVVIPESVTCIEEWAFANCFSLEKVIIPRNVTSIGNFAFNLCNKLVFDELDISNANTIGKAAFNGCKIVHLITKGEFIFSKPSDSLISTNPLDGAIVEKITIVDDLGLIGDVLPSSIKISVKSIILPEGLKVIKEDAFSQCGILESINIPNSVTVIGENAFSSCENLVFDTLDISQMKEVGARAFDYCTIHHLITKGEYQFKASTFKEVKGLAKITITEGSKKITAGLSESARLSLQEVILPDGLEKICSEAFYACRNLTVINIPSSLRTIENNAFAFCSSLVFEDLDLGMLESIGKSAFYDCTINHLVVKGEALNRKEKLEGVKHLNKITFAEGTKTIYAALPDSIKSSLEEISLPEGLTKINEDAFRECENIKKVILPNSLKHIGGYAFARTGLEFEELDLRNVTKLGSCAFKGCVVGVLKLNDNITNYGYNSSDSSWYSGMKVSFVFAPESQSKNLAKWFSSAEIVTY